MIARFEVTAVAGSYPKMATLEQAIEGLVTAPAPAVAAPDIILASCTGGSADIRIDPETYEVNGTATLSGCIAVGHPGIHSATIDIHGTALVAGLPRGSCEKRYPTSFLRAFRR